MINYLHCQDLHKSFYAIVFIIAWHFFNPLKLTGKESTLSLLDRDSILCFTEHHDNLNALVKIKKETKELTEVQDLPVCILLFEHLRNIDISNDSIILVLYAECLIGGAEFHSSIINDKFKAEKLYLEARNLLLKNKAPITKILPKIEYNLGNLYNEIDNYDLSLQFYSSAIEHYKLLKLHDRVAITYHCIGILYAYMGDAEQQLNYFARGNEYAKINNSPIGQVSNLISMYEYYRDCHELDRIMELKNLIPALLFKSKDDINYGYYVDWWQEVQYNSMADTINYKYYTDYYLSELTDHTHNNRDKAKTCISIIECYYYRNQLDSAYFYFNKAMSFLIVNYNELPLSKLSSALYYENSFLDLFKWASKIMESSFLKTGQNKYLYSALSYVDLAIISYNLEFELFYTDNTELANIRFNREYVNLGIRYVYWLYKDAPTEELFNLARHYFNLSKAFQINENIQLTDQYYQFEESKRKKLRILYDSLSLLYRTTNQNTNLTNKEKINAIQIELEKLLKDKNKSSKPIGINGDYIEYCKTDDYYYRISSIHGKHQFNLAAKTSVIDSLAERFNEYLNLNNDTNLLKDLYLNTLANLDLTESDRMTIIPDAKLSLIPFEILRDVKNEDLINKHVLNYAYSYLHRKPGKSSHANHSFFCFQPEYEQIQYAYVDINRDVAYALPNAEVDVKSIENYYNIEKPQNVDIEKWRNLIAFSDYFHFVGHAGVENNEPYLNMGCGDLKKLTAQIIRSSPNQLKLAFLSACMTGRGEYIEGEGVISLGKSFIESGSSSVVSSLWNVNDKSTSNLVSYFYKYLKKGYSNAEALSKAKLAYLNEENTMYKHPKYWAGFVTYGDINVEEDNSLKIMFISALFLLIIFILSKTFLKF